MKTEGLIPWMQLGETRKHFTNIKTEAQFEEIDRITRALQVNWGVDWNPKEERTVLRTYNWQGQVGLSIPFNENSTVDDVQKFIDLLKLTEVHSM